jgi:hypothetical protein
MSLLIFGGGPFLPRYHSCRSHFSRVNLVLTCSATLSMTLSKRAEAFLMSEMRISHHQLMLIHHADLRQCTVLMPNLTLTGFGSTGLHPVPYMMLSTFPSYYDLLKKIQTNS